MISEILFTSVGAVSAFTILAIILNHIEDQPQEHEVDYCRFDAQGKCLTHDDCINDNSEVHFV